jgi:hypothetical protein
MIRRTLIFMLAASSCAFAQTAQTGGPASNQGPDWVAGVVSKVGDEVNRAVTQAESRAAVQVTTLGAAFNGGGTPVVGAPYSATVSNESIQTLADGNRIVQSSTGTIARDSQGRTRQDAALPVIGNFSAANAPHLVFIRDPVTQTSYTLNLSEKIAQKMPAPLPLPANLGAAGGISPVFIQMGTGVAPGEPSPVGPPPAAIFMQKNMASDGQEVTEVLGSQTMQGVLVNGVQTTHTIPAGQIGNDKPIQIVTEVWTSPDLQTIVYSKRSDPRMGEQTFQLTNIQRSEPDPSLFTVPADFKVLDGPQNFIYRTNQ